MITLSLETARFGTVEYLQEDVVTFAEGVLGFPGCRKFLLISHKEGSAFRWLQSIDAPSVAFLVVDPANFFEDYAPEMSDADAAALALNEETPRVVYTIVSIPKGRPEEMTLNLAGPIVINLQTGAAKQIVLEDSLYPIRYRVTPEEATETTAAA